jgi:hypothetical protein
VIVIANIARRFMEALWKQEASKWRVTLATRQSLY